MSKVPAVACCAALMALTGCIDPNDYKTEPVEVKTAKGVVVCQLYTKEYVIWDEAVSVPKGMTIAEGDAICFNEGLKQRDG